MALDRFDHLPLERRAEILRIAAAFFTRHGFENSSYSELLREIGFGKSQAYYYFESKRDLFISVCRAFHFGFYAALGELPVPSSAAEYWQRVRDNTLRGLVYRKQNPLAAGLSRAVARSPSRDSLSAEIAVGDEQGRRAYEDWLSLGRSLGAVREDLPESLARSLALSLLATVDCWFAERIDDATRQDMQDWATLCAGLHQRLLEPTEQGGACGG